MIQPLFHQNDSDDPDAPDARNTEHARNSSDTRQSSMRLNEMDDTLSSDDDRPIAETAIAETDEQPVENGRLYDLENLERAEIETSDRHEETQYRGSTPHDESSHDESLNGESQAFFTLSSLASSSNESKALQTRPNPLENAAKSLSEDVNPLPHSIDLPTFSNLGGLPLRDSSFSIGDQSRSAMPRVNRSGRTNERGLKRKIATIAMAMAMLPVLAVGTATYFSGRLIFDDLLFKADSVATPQEIETTQRQHLDLFALLLIGTGVSALVAGGIARFWALRAFHVAMRSGKFAAEQRFLQRRDRTTQVLTEAIAQIQAAIEQNDVLRVSAAVVRDAMDCDRVLVYQVEDNLEAKVIAESANLSLPSLLGTSIKNSSFTAQYIESDEEVVRAIDDAAASRSEAGGHGAQSILSTSLKGWEKRCFMVAHRCETAHEWQQQEVSLFQHLAAQINVALEQVALKTEKDRLQAQLQTEIQWRNFFEEATRFIHESMTEEEVLKTSVEETRRVLSCDRVVIYSLDGSSQGVIIAESVAPGCMRILGRTIEDPCFETRYLALYADGRVRTIVDVDEADLTPCYADQLKKIAVKASISAPILHDSKVLGLLVAHECSESRTWLGTEVKWFSQLAEQVGYALDNAKFKQQAERLAQADYGERSSTDREAVRLLKNGQTALDSLLTESSSRSNAVVELVGQLQSLTDASRNIAMKAEQAAFESQQLAQGVRDGHRQVEQTAGINTEVQETVARAAAKGQNLSHSTRQISQMMAQIQDWSSQMSQTAIKLSIVSGQMGGKDQGAVVSIAEAALSFTQKIAGATAQLGPLVAAVESDTQSIANDMEIGAEQLIVGAELTQETQHRLNQLTVNGDRLSLLLSQMVDVAPSQSQAVTSTHRQIQEISQLMNFTLEKTAELSDLMSNLETVVQTH
jgi:GAF domain-containing protein